MGASLFRFQQFDIQQDRSAMKVSTDGVMLGAWAPDLKQGRVLDIGTGTGLLALMFAQRNAQVQIDALEIDPAAAQQAKANFEASRFAERLSLFPQSLQNFSPDQAYDLFICNPPYFNAGITPSENARAQARHDKSLDFMLLCLHSARLAGPTAKMALIIPHDRLLAMQTALAKHRWFLQKLTVLKAVPHKTPHRVLLLAGRTPSTLLKDEQTIMDEQNQYSTWFRSLTNAFYL